MRIFFGSNCTDCSTPISTSQSRRPVLRRRRSTSSSATPRMMRRTKRQPEPGSAVSKPGDLWLLGAHRLYCGDALDASSYEAVLDDARAAAIFTDPPYNVRIDGHVCGKGRVRHDEFAMASGEMSEQEFEGFLSAIFAHVRRQKSLGQSDL